MFHFTRVALCLLCLAPAADVVVEPVQPASALTGCRTWIGFDAPWGMPNAHTPRRYHETHVPAQRV